MAQSGGSSPRSSRRSRCSATCTSDRGCRRDRPGSTGSRAIIGPSGHLDAEADVADRLLLGAAVGPRDPGDRPRRRRRRSAPARRRPSPRRPRARPRRGARSAPPGTPSSSVFASSEYATTPPASSARRPGGSVRRAASSPPVHDSASPIRCPRAAAPRPARRSSCRRSLKTKGPWRATISALSRSRELLGAGAVADVDHELGLAQAGRDLERREVDVVLDLAQRLGELGLGDPEQPQRRRPVRLGALEHGLRAGGLERLRPHRVQLARRARAARSPSGPSAGRPARARCRPGRSSSPLGDHRLLAVRDPQRLGVEAQPAREAGEDLGDLAPPSPRRAPARGRRTARRPRP